MRKPLNKLCQYYCAMSVGEDWIFFLEKNPQFYELTKGDFFIRFLQEIEAGAKNISELAVAFPRVEKGDIEKTLDALLKLRVVSRVHIGPKLFFALSDEGKRLLEAYRRARSFYTT